MMELGVASKLVVEGEGLTYEFQKAALTAMGAKENSFTAEGTTYTLEYDGGSAIASAGSDVVALLSEYAVQGVENGTVISAELRSAIVEAIEEGQNSFTFTDENGTEVEYELKRENNRYTIRTATQSKLIQTYLAPSWEHWLGTDGAGMDILTRLMYGGRISLIIGFVVVILETIIGVVLGGLAGYFGKWVDMVIMRIMDIFLAIPGTLLAICIVASLGNSIPNLVIAQAIASTPTFARVVRGAVLTVRGADYVEAARAIGAKDATIIFHDVLPNSLAPIIVQTTLQVASVILSIAGLSFLGLGIPAPTPEWGAMLSAARSYIRDYSYMWMFPGCAIMITILALNLLGDGLRDALDPRLR